MKKKIVTRFGRKSGRAAAVVADILSDIAAIRGQESWWIIKSSVLWIDLPWVNFTDILQESWQNWKSHSDLSSFHVVLCFNKVRLSQAEVHNLSFKERFLCILVAIKLVTSVEQLFKNLQFHTASACLSYLVRLFETPGRIMSFSPVLHIKNSRLWHQRQKNFFNYPTFSFSRLFAVSKASQEYFVQVSIWFEPIVYL